MATDGEDPAASLNALQERNAAKGTYSYYYAHSGDGSSVKNSGGAPRKLQSKPVDRAAARRKCQINKYSWADGSKTVKIYVDLPGVGALPEEAVRLELECSEKRLKLLVATAEKDLELSLPRLNDEVEEKTKVVRKPDMLVITLWKSTAVPWYDLLSKC